MGLSIHETAELPDGVLQVLERRLRHDPAARLFRVGSETGWLRVESLESSGRIAARAVVRVHSWSSIPNLAEDLRTDSSFDNAFVDTVMQVPLGFIAGDSGARIQCDTGSFERLEGGLTVWAFHLQGTPEQVVAGYRKLVDTVDVQWKKAHRVLGYYAPGAEESTPGLADARIDSAYGPGTANAWRREVEAFNADLAAYYQKRAGKPALPA